MVLGSKQNEVTLASLVGYEPSLSEASHEAHEALFTHPLDGASIPKLQQKKRFPSLASLRAQKAALTSDNAAGAVHEEDGCRCKKFLGPMGRPDEVERAADTLTLEEELPTVPTQGAHLAGAAALGLRKSATHCQKTLSIPHKVMQAALSDGASSTKVSQAVKVPMKPRPPSAAPAATGNGKRPIPNKMQVLIVPASC